MNVLTITPHQVMARLARGERVSFVDSRPELAWSGAERKLAGAVRATANAAAPGLLPGGLVVVYGDDGWEIEPLRVAQCLAARGHGQVRILAGGFGAWDAVHGPVTARGEA